MVQKAEEMLPKSEGTK